MRARKYLIPAATSLLVLALAAPAAAEAQSSAGEARCEATGNEVCINANVAGRNVHIELSTP